MTNPQTLRERAEAFLDVLQEHIVNDELDEETLTAILAFAQAVQEDTREELEGDAVIDAETAVRNRDLYYELERNVGRLYPITEKHDVSITYRQAEKVWLVRFISWGPDQTMFMGTDENLMTAALKAHDAFHTAIRAQQGGK